MARKQKHEEEEPENHERWLVTYADMITLLMVLFIVLFSMATVDARKFYALRDSLNGVKESAPTVLQGSPSVVDGGQIQKLETTADASTPSFDLPKTYDATAGSKALAQQLAKEKAQKIDEQNLQEVQKEIQAALNDKGLGDKVQFRRDSRGLVVSIVTDHVLFDSGKADVKPEGKIILDSLAQPLIQIPNSIDVAGYTDNQPINSGPFPTNWELSTTRATSVLRYLTDQNGVPASKLSASGYADQQPIVPNDTPEHRAQNRRVEVVVLTMPTDTAPVPGTTTANSTTPTSTTPTSSDPGAQADVITLPTLPPRPALTTKPTN